MSELGAVIGYCMVTNQVLSFTVHETMAGQEYHVCPKCGVVFGEGGFNGHSVDVSQEFCEVLGMGRQFRKLQDGGDRR